MQDIRRIAVIDIGKTNAKLALVDLASLAEIAMRKTPNVALAEGLYPHYDTDRLWAFILDSLADFQRDFGVDAISVTTHGVAAALIDSNGALAMPVLDYEHDGPEALSSDYDAVRPPFAETGTPRLPVGLNLGAQLYWQSRQFPAEFADVATIVTYPQYWAWRLSGVLANEATSLGCHTDLWDPSKKTYSSMVARMGWLGRMAPVRNAAERLGPVLPDLARRIGLAHHVPVFCGIHDSNASLYPHLLHRRPPFAVVSTGTWVIVMAVGGSVEKLDPARDCLINVDALGEPVPSARFMGGREYSTLLDDGPVEPSERDLTLVIAQGIMLLPSVQSGSGPFPGRQARWTSERDLSPGERHAAVSFYLALMTTTCLDLTGSSGEIIVEGPFAANAAYLGMLAAAAGRPVTVSGGSATGTSIGAALLADGGMHSHGRSAHPRRFEPHADWADYARRWRTAVQAG